jgi:hypothetical protein
MPLAQAIRAVGAPLEVLDIPDPIVRDLCECDVVLVRPDLHVAWRGNQAPMEPWQVAAQITGHPSRAI